jgi:hypothetical protein
VTLRVLFVVGRSQRRGFASHNARCFSLHPSLIPRAGVSELVDSTALASGVSFWKQSPRRNRGVICMGREAQRQSDLLRLAVGVREGRWRCRSVRQAASSRPTWLLSLTLAGPRAAARQSRIGRLVWFATFRCLPSFAASSHLTIATNLDLHHHRQHTTTPSRPPRLFPCFLVALP